MAVDVHSFPIFRFAVAVALVGTLAHVAIWIWARRAFPGRFASRWWIAACAALSILVSALRQVTLHTRHPLAGALSAVSMLELTFVIVACVPLFALTMLARRPVPAPDPAPPPSDPSRRDALQTIGGAAILGATGVTLGWGYTRGRHGYEVRELVVKIAGLPRALDGYVIAQVSDIHSGLFTGPRELAEGFARVREFKPDLVVATGDLVDLHVADTEPVARALADLAPRDGVFGILGNHDYYAGHRGVLEVMRRAGVTMLVNDARVIRPGDGGGFALLGLDDEWSHYGGPSLDRAMASLPRDMPRILLAHQPSAFKRTAGRVALQLSGHTHGGQIRPADLLLRWVAGKYEMNGSTLYVNRGFGVAGPPARLGVPPEITKVVLVAG